MDKTETKEMEGKKHRPDFPEWIKSKEGEDCLKWPISEVKYLHNRLFWAFDAGRNCVWDQYIAQKSELSKAKELNGELVKIKNLVEELIEVAHFRNQWPTTTEAFESLIKKSNL